MHIIEPKDTRKHAYNKKRSRSQKRPMRTISVLLFLVFSGFGFLLVAESYKESSDTAQSSDTLSTATSQDLDKVASATDVKFRYFTGEQFQNEYEKVVYPNTQAILLKPEITGDGAADTRIRTIAESRGYKLRSVPVFPIIRTNEPKLESDDLLQPKAYIAWQSLKRRASADNVPILVLNSGYRTIELQREMFLERLKATGSSISAIASGKADSAVVSVLSQVAPPGYSRHHTGYTIDLRCDDGSGQSFKQTVCFEWLSANNYENAKRSGWVPSYPEGVSDQGPEPESWEYVWVGVSRLLED